MKRAHVKLLAVVAALYAAPPGVDRVNQPVALLLVGKNARLTQGGQKRASLSMPEGELIRWGARMHTGGERVRYLSFQDGGIYEFEHTRAPFPAPSSAVNEEPDFEIRFVTPKVETRGGQVVQRGSVPARLGDVNPARVLLDAAGDPAALAALQRIDSELKQPANRENAALRFARAVMLEKAKQFADALDEYKTLARRFADAAWLRKKVPELTAASRLWQEREALGKTSAPKVRRCGRCI